MARVFFFGRAAIGHINPSAGLVSGLIQRGEQVFYYAENGYNDRISESGAEVRNYNYSQSEPDPGASGNDGLQALLGSVKYLYNLSRHLCKQLLQDIERDKPDYIIYDSCAYWGRLLSRIYSLPAISSITTFICSRTVIEAEPGLFIEGMLGMNQEEFSRKYMNIPVHELLEKLSQPFRNFSITSDFFLMDVFNACADLNIAYTSREFQPGGNCLPPDYLFTGPSVSHRQEQPFSINRENGKKLIYISMGTVLDAGTDFYAKIFAAFRESPYQIILSTGNKSDVTGTLSGTPPDNVVIREYVPQLSVLKEADLFISHGGMNGINEAILQDTPLLIIPKGIDRVFNAKVIEKRKAGIVLDFATFSPQELRIAADAILSYPVYMNNIASIRESFLQCSGVQAAVDNIIMFKKEKNIHC